MKKSLIAVAVASAIAAPVMAQNVTISGNLDAAFASVSGQTAAVGQTISTTLGTGTTSVINIQAVEDLGGGMRVTAKYGLDPRPLFNDNFVVTSNTGSATGTNTASLANTATGLARDEAFVGISGAFGNLRLGSPNSIGLNNFQISSFAGTGIGSGYGGTGALVQSYSAIRYNRSARYDTPVMNGFSASVLYAPGGDVAAGELATTSQTGGTRQPLTIPNGITVTEVGLRLSQGPITAGYARIMRDLQQNGTGWYGTGSATRRQAVNLFDASVVLGSTSVGVGYHSGDTTSSLDTSGYRISIRQDFGVWDLIAQYSRLDQNTSATAAVKPVVQGLRADYKLSKTSAAYVGYESWDTDRAYDTTANTTTGKRNIGSVGLRKVF